jgi:hypothetical protein
MTRRFSENSRITVVFVGVSGKTFHVKRFWYRRRENMSRDGLFLRVCIADAAREQMAQRISAKVRITVVAVGLSDANVSRETVI